MASKGAALVLGVAAVGAFASSAHAAVTVYNSQAAFNAAAPGATTFGFNAGGGLVLNPNPLSLHGLMFKDEVTAQDMATGGFPLLFTVSKTLTPTYGKDFLSYENTQPGIIGDILSGGTTAIGFTYGSFVSTGGGVTVTLNTGDSFAITPTSTAAFLGFTSTTPITSISMDYPGGFALDLTSVSVLGVPEPSTWAMMLLGFGGLGAAMRVRRRSPAAA
jgi:hypothetical protein